MAHIAAFPAALALAFVLQIGCAGGQQPPEHGDDAMSDERGEKLEAAKDRIATLEADLADVDAKLAACDAGAGAESPRPFSPDGLTEQPRAAAPRAMPEHFEPGPTDWRKAPIPEGFGRNQAREYASAGELAAAVAESVAGPMLGIDLFEVTTRALVADDGRTAQAAVLMWGLKDDAGEGEDLRLDVRHDERGWYVAAAERRSWCRRGVTDDGDLCL